MQQTGIRKTGLKSWLCLCFRKRHSLSEPQFLHLENGPNKNITLCIRRTEFQPLMTGKSHEKQFVCYKGEFFSLDLYDSFVKQTHSPFRPQLQALLTASDVSIIAHLSHHC